MTRAVSSFARMTSCFVSRMFPISLQQLLARLLLDASRRASWAGDAGAKLGVDRCTLLVAGAPPPPRHARLHSKRRAAQRRHHRLRRARPCAA